MKPIAEAVDKTTIKNELKKIRLLKHSRYGNHDIYTFCSNESPVLMQEVGRLREITFRHAGGGTGESLDIDTYDNNFKQLIVYNPQNEEIMGGYRYLSCQDIKVINNRLLTPTGDLFNCSKKFIDNIVPFMVELGRSFVTPEYQTVGALRKSIFVLENLWMGLGAIVSENPNIKYTFGKFTMYPDYNVFARDILLNFLNHYFPSEKGLCYPIEPIKFQYDLEELNKYFVWNDYDKDYNSLIQVIKNNGEIIPPLVNSYMNLSNTMKVFGTAFNHHFGETEETGILITIGDIEPVKLIRYGLENRIKK